MTPSIRFELAPQGAFSLEMIRKFQCGLMSASRSCSADPSEVRFAFPLDGTFQPVGVRLREQGGRLIGEAVGTCDEAVVARQVARILSVDVDGRPFERLARADPVLARELAVHPGFRPPIFFSPYAGGGWLLLGHRISRRQAAALQKRIALEAGDTVKVEGELLASFPRPETFLCMEPLAGVPRQKWARLQAFARAALDGRLEPERLRALPHDLAREELMKLPGVGPWTADGILMRACGLHDLMITAEREIHRAVQHAYELDHTPSDEALLAIAERWRPYRAWVSVLLVMRSYREQKRAA